jgi:hypothetical protein
MEPAGLMAAPEREPDAPRIGEPDLGLSLDEILARVEAQDAEHEAPADPEPTAILYDDLSEIGEATLEPLDGLEHVIDEDPIASLDPDETIDPSDWTKDD